jgi:hypothetical protein
MMRWRFCHGQSYSQSDFGYAGSRYRGDILKILFHLLGEYRRRTSPSQHPLRTNVRISNELMASLECSHLTGVAHLNGMNKNLACDKIE